MYTFLIENFVQGYYEYKDIWDATIDGIQLPGEREPGNSHSPSAVAMVKGTQVKVSLSAMFLHLFQRFVQYLSVGEDLLCVL